MIKILGHRASLSEGPYENTTPAIEHALKYADGMETDIVISAEGGLFLVHDNMFMYNRAEYLLYSHLNKASRKAAGAKRTDQMSDQEIRSLQTVTDEPIPALEDLLNMVSGRPDFVLNLELKSDLTALPTIEYLKPYIESGKIVKEQIIFSSFNYPELLKVRETDSAYKIGLLLEPSDRISTLIYPWSDNKESIYHVFCPNIITDPLVKAIQPDFFNLENDDVTAENIDLIHDSYPETKIMMWYSYREPPPKENDKLFQKLDGLGDSIYAVISNYPQAMKERFMTQSESLSA